MQSTLDVFPVPGGPFNNLHFMGLRVSKLAKITQKMINKDLQQGSDLAYFQILQ